MSGVEVSKEPKEPQVHVCSSCVKTVVQYFTYYQEQIAKLNQEKEKLQDELRKLIKNNEKQKQAIIEEIRILEERLALLDKPSESHI